MYKEVYTAPRMAAVIKINGGLVGLTIANKDGSNYHSPAKTYDQAVQIMLSKYPNWKFKYSEGDRELEENAIPCTDEDFWTAMKFWSKWILAGLILLTILA